MSQPWKNQREWNDQTIHEKIEIAETILKLDFNQENKPWLVMISGDHHMLAYDTGEFNLFGGFPIF